MTIIDATTPPNAPRLTVTPADSRVDEPVHVRLVGVGANQRVTLRAEVPGLRLASEAVYRADAEGCIDLDTTAPESGAYTGAEGMGLFWSLETVASTKYSGRGMVISAEIDGEEVSRCKIKRRFKAADVRRIEVREDGLYGTLFFPPVPGPHPALIVVGGSGGGLNEVQAALLASQGFMTLALAYFAYEDLPANLIEIPLEYFEGAADWLAAREGVKEGAIGLLGGSRGAELVLLLASHFERFAAVVAYCPSNVAWGGFSSDKNDAGKAAWTLGGEPLPLMQVSRKPSAEEIALWEKCRATGDPWPGTPGFLRNMEDKDAVLRAAIRVEESSAAILLVSGGDDQMWPGSHFGRWLTERLDAHDYKRPYEHLSYPEAGHTIGFPNMPQATGGLHPVDGMNYAWGGTVRANAEASRDSWPRVIAFLKANL